MVQTIKFSQFATSTPNNATNRLVGFANGMNIQQSIPVIWTVATRPITPYDGLLGYNTDLEQYEYWNQSRSQWIQLGTGSGQGIVNPGFTGEVAYYAAPGDAVSGLPTFSNGVLATNVDGIPSITQNFPAAVQINPGSFDSGSGASSDTFLRGDGTWATPPGDGTVNPGLQNQLAYYAVDGSAVTGLGTGFDGVLITGDAGAPSISSFLPFAVQQNINTLGTVTTGSWQSQVITGAYGGTGVNNGSSTITVGGNVKFSGAFTSQFDFTSNTIVTFPTSGTLATTTNLNSYLLLSGGTMTGLIVLSGNATASLNPVPLQQVQSLISGISVTGTTNQISVTGTPPNFIVGFPSVLHTVNGTVLDDGSANMTVGTNLTVSGLTASMPVLTNASKQLVSGGINLTTNVTGVLPLVNGGTGLSTIGIYSILMGNAGGTGYAGIGTPTTAQVLVTSDFAGNEPQWAGALPFGVQNNITEVGTIVGGTWHGSIIGGTYGGTGINNGASTISVGGNFQMSGAFTFMGNLSANTNVTFPTSGTLATTAGLGAFLPLAGGTMTGNLILNGDATSALQAVTLEQLQAVESGFNIKDACYASTTANLTGWTYNNGTAGVGATLTAPSTGVFGTDGTTPPVGSRILVQLQTAPSQNGIFGVTTSASGSNAVLTRTTDYDTTAQIFPGNLIIVDNGTLYAGTGWLQTATVNTIGTDPISFSPFNLINAGTGLTRTGNTISLTNPVALNLGGTNAALTAANGGILYSNASQLQILAPTVTAGQMIQSGASTGPSWTTTTWPATSAINTLLYSSSANVISALATANNGILITSGTGVPSISSTLPSAVQTNITTVGTISSGTWNGGVIGSAFGGTGVNNGSSIITIGGSHTLTGAFTSAFTFTANTAVTFPTSGTLATVAGTISNVVGTANQIDVSVVSGVATVSIDAAYIGQTSITTLGTLNALAVVGTVNLNNTTSSAAINIGASSSYTGAVTIGGNGITVNANSTGSITIGNALNSVFIGSQGSANSIVNIQTGTGSGSTNIASTSGYSGTISIGNASCVTTLAGTVNINNAAGSVLIAGTSSSGTITIGNNTGASTTNISGIVNINTASSSAVNIGTGTYSGTVSIGGATVNVGSTTVTTTNNIQCTTSGTVNIQTNSLGGITNIGHLTTTAVGGLGGIVNIAGGVGLGLPLTYSTGTCSTSGASQTVTGAGTSWTTTMIGGIILVTGGASAGVIAGITAVGSTTSLTTDNAVTIASGSSFIIYYASHQISPRSVAFCTSANQFSFTVGTQSFGGAITLGNTSLYSGTISLLTSSLGKVVTTNNTLDGGSGTGSFAGLLTLNAGETITGAYNNNLTGSAAINIGSTSYSGTINLGNTAASIALLGNITIAGSGSTTVTIGNGASPSLTQVRGTITLGDADPAAGTSIGIADSGSITTTKTINIGNNTSTPSITTIAGTVSINNTSSSSNITIGNNSTYTGTVSIGGAIVNIVAAGTGALNIGNSANPISIGATSTANSSVSIQPGTGSGATGICSGGYTGTLTIGSSGSTTNHSGIVTFTNGTSTPLTITNNDGSLSFPNSVMQVTGPDVNNFANIMVTRSGVTTSKRTMICMRPTVGSLTGWEILTDTASNGTSDFGIYNEALGGFGFTINTLGQFVTKITAPFFATSVASISTGNQTITAAQCLGFLVQAPLASSAFTWTTDTGTNLYTATGSPAVGTTFTTLWQNNNNSGSAIMTIAFGSGVTGSLRANTLSNNSSMLIYFRCTGVNTFTAYS